MLDLGSGGGIDALLAARRDGDRGFVYGIGMTDEMLDLARRNARHRQTGLQLIRGYRFTVASWTS